MASEVDICNLALANIGDPATVIMINPPDNTPQAAHCYRFYPIARDELLAMHDWDFCKKRVVLPALATDATDQWKFVYSVPSDMLSALQVIQADAPDDVSFSIPIPYSFAGSETIGRGVYTPQPFALEIGALGQPILYTNVENAMLLYTFRATNVQLFPPLFVSCLSWLLAAKLAGAIIKGSGGVKVVQACQEQFKTYFAIAAGNDSTNRFMRPAQMVDWIANR
jgi:hypothetical protein